MAAFEYDWVGAKEQLTRAIELNPNYATAHFYLSLYYFTPRGETGAAIAEMKTALTLDPLSAMWNTMLGFTYYFARDYEHALEQYNSTLHLYPDFFIAHARYRGSTPRWDAIQKPFPNSRRRER